MRCEHDTENCPGRGEKHTCWTPTLEELIKDHHVNNDILRSVNDAIIRAGIHYAVTYSEAIDMLASRATFNREDSDLLLTCVNFRIKELKEAVDRCLNRGSCRQLESLHITGQEAKEQIAKLVKLRKKL